MKDYFSILGIPRTASETEIRSAYRRLAKRWHPDANRGEPSAQRLMQDLNRAKEVLFNVDTRTEYINLLEMQDALSQENLERLRTKFRDIGDISPTPVVTVPAEDRSSRKLWIVLVVIAVIGVAAGYYGFTVDASKPVVDPVQAIIDRNMPITFPSDTLREFTVNVPDHPPERLAQMASLLSLLGEHYSSAKYWERAYERDPSNSIILTNIAIEYMELKKYKTAFDKIESASLPDTSKALIYKRLADYFRMRGKTWDAENALTKAEEYSARK